MSTHPIVQDDRFHGNKSLDLATPATLIARLVQYEGLATNATTPPAVRDYSHAVVTEIRAELACRSPLMTGVAA